MKNNRHRSIAHSREWDPIPECELLSLRRPVLGDADHEPTTRKANLGHVIADRLVIERGEDEELIVHEG